MSAAAIVGTVIALVALGLVSRIDDQLQRIAEALEASAQADAYQARRTQRLDAEADQLERRIMGGDER